MLQTTPTDERMRVWRLQRDLVRTSLTVCTRGSEKERVRVKGADRRDLARGYDRA